MKGCDFMRLVPINCIKEGSYLAKTIYDTGGRVLLATGYRLTNSVLKRVEQTGILSLYVNDEYSDNEIEDFIKPELRQLAVKTIKSNFEGLTKQSNRLRENSSMVNSKEDVRLKYKYIDSITKIAGDIVEELSLQKNVLINLVDIKSMDNYTYEHSVNVTILALVLGIELKLDKNKLMDLAIGGILHDLGKIFMPREVLLKNGKLTDEEYAIIKEHPVKGYEYIRDNIDISIVSRNVMLQHHEKIDGTGYPYGIKGDKIHKFGKIVAIADVYDALTSDRPYRRAMSPNEAMEFLMGTAGRHFDFDLVSTFIRKIVPYPIGTLVRMSNGYIGVIEQLNPDFPLRPSVRVIKPDYIASRGVVIDLMKENSIVIEGVQYEIPK